MAHIYIDTNVFLDQLQAKRFVVLDREISLDDRLHGVDDLAAVRLQVTAPDDETVLWKRHAALRQVDQ